MTKITYMGKDVSRDSVGRYSSFKTKANKFAWYLFAAVILTGSGMLATLAMTSSTMEVATAKAEIIDKTPETLADLENDLVAVIKKGETPGYAPKEGDVFSSFDPSDAMRASCMQTGGRRPLDCESYGPYQEKIGTIRNYAEQVYGHTVTQQEALNIAINEASARDFFLKCSEKIDGCVWNWTAAQHNKDYVNVIIPLIRKLQK